MFRLPRIRLECLATGNVFTHDEVPGLAAEVHDSDGDGLAAELVVRDAAGDEQWRGSLPVCRPGDPQPQAVTFPKLTRRFVHRT